MGTWADEGLEGGAVGGGLLRAVLFSSSQSHGVITLLNWLGCVFVICALFCRCLYAVYNRHVHFEKENASRRRGSGDKESSSPRESRSEWNRGRGRGWHLESVQHSIDRHRSARSPGQAPIYSARPGTRGAEGQTPKAPPSYRKVRASRPRKPPPSGTFPYLHPTLSF